MLKDLTIGRHFKQANPTTPAALATREAAHLVWAGNVAASFLENLPHLEVMTDPHIQRN